VNALIIVGDRITVEAGLSRMTDASHALVAQIIP